MPRRIFRHYVVAGGRAKSFELTGSPLHVEARRLGVGMQAPHLVDFWVEHDDDLPAATRTFQVFGTGHPLPPGARYVGSTARTADGFVWHLYELEGP